MGSRLASYIIFIYNMVKVSNDSVKDIIFIRTYLRAKYNIAAYWMY